ncbi:MAG: rod shape-determining protein MreD [Rickettsiales bacterium]|nr:rod shape-determining protein MreD [Rickettsiales bacterium]
MLGQKSISKVVALHFIAILFVIFNISDVKIAGLTNVIPLFDLMMIFYFAVFRNDFDLWFVFLMGIWNDAITGNTLGVTALCYILLVKLFIILNRKLNIRDNFQHILKQFIFFAFVFLLMKWVLLSLFSGALYNAKILLVQFILSSVFYVVMHKFFDYLSIKLLGNE